MTRKPMRTSLVQYVCAIGVIGMVASPTMVVGAVNVAKTTSLSEAAAFQAGATVEKFDDLTAFAITSYDAGQTIDVGAKFSSRDPNHVTAPTFHSGGASFNDPAGNPGTPIGIFDPNGPIGGDVVSADHVAGPLVINEDQPFSFGFMEVIFPTTVRRVGFWVTQGSINFDVRDATGTAIDGSRTTVSKGEFVMLTSDAADIKVAALIPTVSAFTIDDFTFSPEAVPEPAGLVGGYALLLALIAKRVGRSPNRFPRDPLLRRCE